MAKNKNIPWTDLTDRELQGTYNPEYDSYRTRLYKNTGTADDPEYIHQYISVFFAKKAGTPKISPIKGLKGLKEFNILIDAGFVTIGQDKKGNIHTNIIVTEFTDL